MAQLMWSSEACTNISCTDILDFDGSVHPNDRGKWENMFNHDLCLINEFHVFYIKAENPLDHERLNTVC